MIPLALFILVLAALGLCFASNRDIFSPAKFYHVSLTVFFVDIFLSEQNGYVYAVYFAFILGGMLMSILEACALARRRAVWKPQCASGMIPWRFVLVLWALSIVPVVLQLHLIDITGGWGSLTRTIALRVMEHRGLGVLTILIRLMMPINQVYFAIGLIYAKRRPFRWWLLFVLHLFLFIVVVLPMGSRGLLLGHLLFMMIIYNYLRRPVKLRYALVGGVALLVIAAFLGTVRQNITRIDSVDSLRRMQGDAFNLRMLSYGTMPLKVVFLREFDDLQYGKTLLSAVTNFVPRSIWPGKFDTGGVVLTKFAHGRSYIGTSHLSTGIVAESILNFGYPLGVLWAFVFLVFAVLLTVHLYSRFLSRMQDCEGLGRICLVVVYVSLAGIAGALLLSEFTNVFVGVVTRLVFLLLVLCALRLRLSPNRLVAVVRAQNRLEKEVL